jgi:hypothetical protein
VDPQRSRSAVTLERALFSGSKAKWLPLFRRLLARVSGIPGVEVVPGKTSIVLSLVGQSSSEFALIKVAASGLELRLAIPKAQLRSARLKRLARATRPAMSHVVTVAETTDLDEELLSWLKAARNGARTSKDKSS